MKKGFYNLGLQSVVGGVAGVYLKRCEVFLKGRAFRRWFRAYQAYRCMCFLWACLGFYEDSEVAVEVASAYFLEVFRRFPSARGVVAEAWRWVGFEMCCGSFGVSELRRQRSSIWRSWRYRDADLACWWAYAEAQERSSKNSKG